VQNVEPEIFGKSLEAEGYDDASLRLVGIQSVLNPCQDWREETGIRGVRHYLSRAFRNDNTLRLLVFTAIFPIL
jgi:hypothetical protein